MNGALAWIPLGKDATPFEGPNWRRGVVGDEARGYVAALEEGRLLATDGARGLTVWDWPQPARFTPLPAGREPPTIELPDRIIGVPLLLPQPAPDGGRRVVVPTADGTLSLLAIQSTGIAKIERNWKLSGPVSAELFLLPANGGHRIGCIVGGVLLVALDPGKEEPAWEHRTTGKAIVGTPQMAGPVLIVADHSGRYVGLDPATGKPAGPGHLLAGTLGPAATPVPFGTDRLFTPLTDGTVLLLPLKRLTDAQHR
jgi:outer membrane protein assembly factor BamB